MLVLDGAPLDRIVAGALWAAYARGGHGVASLGRIVMAPGAPTGLIDEPARGDRGACASATRATRRPRSARSASRAEAEAVEALVADGRAGGRDAAVRRHRRGSDFCPALLRGVAPDARVFHEAVPGPVLSVVEAGSEDGGDRAVRRRAGRFGVGRRPRPRRARRPHAERPADLGQRAQRCGARGAGRGSPATPSRASSLSRSIRLRSARWLPYDPTLVRASETAARIIYGRGSERWDVIRRGGPAFARVAVRMARETLRRG